jgi:hypothetical protein
MTNWAQSTASFSRVGTRGRTLITTYKPLIGGSIVYSSDFELRAIIYQNVINLTTLDGQLGLCPQKIRERAVLAHIGICDPKRR